MSTNPYHDEPTHVQPVLPPMEELQPRPAPTPLPVGEVGDEPDVDMDAVGAGQEEARTIIFAIGKLNDFLLWFLMVLEVTLFVRFVFRLIAADPRNMFAGFLYALTEIVLLPFSNIVKTPSLVNWAFEWPTLIAMGIYALIFIAVRSFLRLLISTPKEPVE
ncbi:MAG: YggT family protein [Ktedonobacteraceae bacterium]|nr:YggT family protein [Chloroflexota bacterium]